METLLEYHMRVLNIVSAIFVFAVLFLTLNAESEECQYENMTVSTDQNIVIDGEHIWLCGDILIAVSYTHLTLPTTPNV